MHKVAYAKLAFLLSNMDDLVSDARGHYLTAISWLEFSRAGYESRGWIGR
jgi:hypothetical protein